MSTVGKKVWFAVLVLLVSSLVLAALAGCGGSGKVTVLSFYGKDSESAKEFKPTLDKAKKEYKDEVIFEDIDMDDPANKGKIEEYHVSMDPTYIILNAEGKVTQTFMGKPHEEMFVSAIAGLLPKKGTTPSSAPGGPSPLPSTSAPTSAPSVPGIPTQ